MAHTAIGQQEKAGDKLKSEEKYKILESLKNKNSFETKQALQKQLPDYDPTPKSVAYPKNENVQVNLNFTLDQWQEVKEFLAKNSHKVPDQKLETLLLKVARADKEKVEKSLSSRKAISENIRSYIFWKADGKCQFVSGTRF